jgi:starch synthase
MTGTQVLAVTPEVYPLIKTGGLADVTGALPGALASEGVTVTTLVPGYPAVMRALRKAQVCHQYTDLFGGPARLLRGVAAGLDLFVLDAPQLFERPGGPYADPHGTDWPDNALRFAGLSRVAADLGQGLLTAYQPALIHAHDWPAGLAAAYLQYSDHSRPATVMTVHNLAFQGRFDRALLPVLGLPRAAFSLDGVEYFGGVGYLKAGLRLSDRITTVSPTYAAEICTPEGGMGLDGLIRGRADRLAGILNGIDVTTWDPANDPLIATPYDRRKLAGRAANRRTLQARFGLDPEPRAMLFGVVSRLTWQKGLDLLLAALPTLLAEGAQLAVLGSGEAVLEGGFAAAAAALPGRVAFLSGYDEPAAHQMQAGADALLVPSRFEPCGLTQLCALRYGAVPIVARVGGLADTVVDASPMALAAGAATGVQFAPVSVPMLEHAIRRAAALYRDKPMWRRLQANGMATDVSWAAPARLYAELFRSAIAERRSLLPEGEGGARAGGVGG